MTTILPFRQPSARTSPQHDRKAVPVNVTAPDCEAVRDMLAQRWMALWIADDPAERAVWDDFMAADRMARGLR